MFFEHSSQREFTQLMTDHVFRHEYWKELSSIVNIER